MIVNVTDIESMIRGYIVSTINENNPYIDTSVNSPYDDIFIKPMISILRPFIEKLNKAELSLDLNNANYMTESELDERIENNYFITRRSGSTASTVVTLSFANLSLEDPDFRIKVPAGTVFATSSGLEFQTQVDTFFSVSDLSKGYNKANLVNEVDVTVYAKEMGYKYNVSAGEIKICKTAFSTSLVSVVNKVAATNGSDKESNANYAKRAKAFRMSRQLGTSPGYKNFILDTFKEVSDVYVSGYKDAYMERDLLKVYDDVTKQIIEKHVGGMVDIYIKGCNYAQDKKTITVNSNYIILPVKFSQLKDQDTPVNSIKVYNLSDSSKKPEILSISAISNGDLDGKYVGYTKIVINNRDNISFDTSTTSNMKANFLYSSEGVSISDDYYFQIGTTTSQLPTPLKSIDSMTFEDGTAVSSMESRFNITKTGFANTSDEVSYINIINCDDIPNGTNIVVSFTVNETIRNIGFVLNTEENRIIVCDILIREATPVPVNICFRVKLTSRYKLSDADLIKSKIKTSISNFFQNYQMGDSVEESDIVTWLQTDDSTKDIVQYVALPFDVFYIPKDSSEDIPSDGSQHVEDGVLNIKGIEYPFLNIPKFKVDIIP